MNNLDKGQRTVREGHLSDPCIGHLFQWILLVKSLIDFGMLPSKFELRLDK